MDNCVRRELCTDGCRSRPEPGDSIVPGEIWTQVDDDTKHRPDDWMAFLLLNCWIGPIYRQSRLQVSILDSLCYIDVRCQFVCNDFLGSEIRFL